MNAGQNLEAERDRLIALPPVKTGPTSTVRFVADGRSVRLVYSRPGAPDEPARYFCGDLFVGANRAAERKLVTPALGEVKNLEFERENGPLPDDAFEFTSNKGTKLFAWISEAGHVLVRFTIRGEKREMVLDKAYHHGEIGGSGCHFQIDDKNAIERLIAMRAEAAPIHAEAWRRADNARKQREFENSGDGRGINGHMPMPWKYRND